MSYAAVSEIRMSQSLISRINACAAQCDVPGDPIMWVQSRLWDLIKDPAWAAVWVEATSTRSPNVNPDTGARTDVISDEMILDAVRAVQQG